MQRSLAAASLALCFAAAVPPTAAHAQDLAALCARVGHPPVGAWSEFKVVGGQNDGATMRMSVVGSETRAGTSYIWLETAGSGYAAGAGGGGGAGRAAQMRMVYKMLVPGFGPAWGQAQAVIVKYGDAPAMEMPVTHGRSSTAPGAQALQRCRDAKVVGWENITVPAGTFRALHVRNADNRGEAWVDPDLPFALVKDDNGSAPGAESMVLVGQGRGARSVITERPQPYNPAVLMQMMQGARPKP